MSTTVYIYGLCDPRTGELRYIGKSKHWRQRSYEHLCASHLKASSYKNHWVKSLLSIGLKPEAFVIEEVAPSLWQEAERDLISYFKSLGCRLTNSTSGGDGTHDMPADVRMKIGDSCRGKARIFSAAHIAKIAAANRARSLDPAWRARMSASSLGNNRGLGKRKPESHRAALAALRKAEFAAMNKEQLTAFAMRGVAARLGKPARELSCVVCETAFVARDKKAKHCSGKCRQRWHRAMKNIHVID